MTKASRKSTAGTERSQPSDSMPERSLLLATDTFDLAQWVPWFEAMQHVAKSSGSDLRAASYELDSKRQSGALPVKDRFVHHDGKVEIRPPPSDLTFSWIEPHKAARIIGPALLAISWSLRSETWLDEQRIWLEEQRKSQDARAALAAGIDPASPPEQTSYAAVAAGGKNGVHNIIVQRDVLLRLWPNPEQATVAKPARPSNRGRKTKFSWDIIGAEVFRRLYEDGLPAPGEVTEFSDNVLQWCDGNLEKVPDLDALRKKIGIWLSRIPRSR